MALDRNGRGHLLLAEWLDVAAERVEAMLAHVNSPEPAPVGPRDSLDELYAQLAAQQAAERARLTAWQDAPEREEEERQRRAEAALSRQPPLGTVPCHVCGKSRVHDHDCSRRGTPFVVVAPPERRAVKPEQPAVEPEPQAVEPEVVTSPAPADSSTPADWRADGPEQSKSQYADRPLTVRRRIIQWCQRLARRS